MSRSYKKTPVIKDNGHGAHRRWNKKQANRVVRNDDTFDISGKAYRKLYSSWDIYDYISYNPWVKEVNRQSNTNVFWGVGRYIHYLNSIRDKNYSYEEWKKDRPNRNEWEKWYRRK